MANKTYQGRIVQKHDTSTNWAKATNFIPLKGEIIIYDDLNKIKIGDGTTNVNSLKFTNNKQVVEIILSEPNDANTFNIVSTGIDYLDVLNYEQNYLIYLSFNGLSIPISETENAIIEETVLLDSRYTDTNTTIHLMGYDFQGPYLIDVYFTGKNQVHVSIQKLITLEQNVITQDDVTSIKGLIKSDGTTITAATAGVDYIAPVSGGTVGQIMTKTANGEEWADAPKSFPDGGTAGDALVKTANGEDWETPIEATLVSLPTGILKSDGTTISAATAGVDYHSITNKYTFTVTDATQSTFTIPFDFNNDSGTLTAYYNGVMMKETDNYTISNNTLTLVEWSAKKGDYLTVMGIEGAASVNVDAKLALIQQAVEKASSDMDSKVASASTDINNKVTSAIKQIDDKLATIPDDVEQAVYKNKSNIMTKDGKITMDSTYIPSADGDVVTKKYVDNSAVGLFSSSKNGIVPKSDGSTTKYLRADGSWATIDKTPVIGTTTDYAIYIGTSKPASGTTPLLWIDTTSSTGYLKYRTSTTGTWTTVPVAWS